MFKKMMENQAISNPEIEADEVLTVLSNGMPKWQWRVVKNKGDQFEIAGKRRWHRFSIIRNPKGHISSIYDDSILWTICTLGLTYVLADLSKARHRAAVHKLLKERVHRPEL